MSVMEWRAVPGWEGFYEVSNRGEVKALSRTVHFRDGRTRAYQEHIKKRTSDDLGYQVTRLCDKSNGRACTRFVHRLVAQAFNPNPDNKGTVNHKDCNPRNNKVDNLEWASQTENMHHAWDNNRIPRGSKRTQAKLTEEIVKDARRRAANGESCRRLAKIYGVHNQTMWLAVNRRTWFHT